jgi:hypothetical protein
MLSDDSSVAGCTKCLPAVPGCTWHRCCPGVMCFPPACTREVRGLQEAKQSEILQLLYWRPKLPINMQLVPCDARLYRARRLAMGWARRTLVQRDFQVSDSHRSRLLVRLLVRQLGLGRRVASLELPSQLAHHGERRARVPLILHAPHKRQTDLHGRRVRQLGTDVAAAWPPTPSTTL